MGFDIIVLASVLWMLYMAFAMNTGNNFSLFLFRILPFLLSIGLGCSWAWVRGFVQFTTGG